MSAVVSNELCCFPSHAVMWPSVTLRMNQHLAAKRSLHV